MMEQREEMPTRNTEQSSEQARVVIRYPYLPGALGGKHAGIGSRALLSPCCSLMRSNPEQALTCE